MKTLILTRQPVDENVLAERSEENQTVRERERERERDYIDYIVNLAI